MRDVTDNVTGELEVGEVKRGRGRPRKANAMTNAQRQAAYRARRRDAVTVTKIASRFVPQVDAYDESRLEVDQLRAELVEIRGREGIAWREMRSERDQRELLSRELVACRRELAELRAKKTVTSNDNPVSFETMLDLIALTTKANTTQQRIKVCQTELFLDTIARKSNIGVKRGEALFDAIIGDRKIVTKTA